MELHPRLQQPSVDSPVKRGHGFTLALALVVLAAGFAYAMPKAMNTSATETTDSVELTPTGSTQTETATTPTPSPTPTDDADDPDDEGGERKQNHGAAVSTAAHCDLHGKAHGEFVRSIAHDKDATVAEVEEACEAAKAAAAAAGSGDGEVAKPGRGHSKPPKVKFDDETEAVDDTDDEGDDDAGEPAETVPDADSKPGGGPPDHAKGNKDKP